MGEIFYNPPPNVPIITPIPGRQDTLLREFCGSSSLPMTSGTMRLGFFTAAQTLLMSNVRILTGAVAAGFLPSVLKVGLYSVAPSGTLTLAAATNNAPGAMITPLLSAPVPLATSYQIQVGARYALGLLIVTAAATPQIFGTLSPDQLVLPTHAGIVTGLANLPGSVALESITSDFVYPYLSLTV